MSVKIAASILSADFGHLQDAVDAVSSADILQHDVMDGHFVSNLSFGPPVISSLKTKLFQEAHLMVSNPQDLLFDYAKAGCKRLIVHAEVVKNLKLTLQDIKALGCQAGVALNPQTPLDPILEHLDDIDMVLCMTVNPGFGGQKFISEVLDKVKALREKFDKEIEVDGGIDDKTAKLSVDAGANVLLAGSYIVANKQGLSPKEAIESLRKIS